MLLLDIMADCLMAQFWIFCIVVHVNFLGCLNSITTNASVQSSYAVSDTSLLFSGTCRVNKENRAAGILENFAEGERYAEHSLRKLVRNRAPEIMPSLNSFFADPK